MTATTQPNDPTRMYVAIVKLCKSLGVKPDANVPDHELLERLADAAHALPKKLDVENMPCPCDMCVREKMAQVRR